MTDEKPPRDLKGHSYEDLPFSQRHGGASIPDPYQQGTLSRAFRLEVISYLKYSRLNLPERLLNSNEQRSFVDFFKRYMHVYLENEFLEFRGERLPFVLSITDFDGWHAWPPDIYLGLSNKLIEDARSVLGIDGDNIQINDCMEFLEFLCNHEYFETLREVIKKSLGDCQEGYYLTELNGRYLIEPRASAEEGEANRINIEGVELSDWQKVKEHLGVASRRLSNADFDGAVIESVNAIESAARNLTEERDLKKSLKRLEKEGRLSPSLCGSLVKLYGYAKDGPGHGQPDSKKRAPITEAEAMLCWSVAVSVTHYLWRKHGQEP